MSRDLFPSASACGKVILCGEHAVVYGIPALACGLPDGLTLRATPLARASDPSRLRIAPWGLDLDLLADTAHPVVQAARAILAFCDGPTQGWHIEGQTTLPARAGLGSSATLGVALARLVWGNDAATDDVVAASMAGERIFHGNPSGIDSEVAARGGILRYLRGEKPQELRGMMPVHLAIVPSEIPRSTAQVVAEVRARRDRCPAIIQPILNSIAALVDSAQAALLSNDLNLLAEALQVNHHLLGALGASSAALDELCHGLLEHGALAAKLTGAGRGGSVFGLFDQPRASLVLDTSFGPRRAFFVAIFSP